MDDRWFISYRNNIRDFMNLKFSVEYKAVVTNISPAKWVREHTVDYHIQYAERISVALASELIHGGAGVPAEYYDIND